jgi:hypothetical protein
MRIDFRDMDERSALCRRFGLGANADDATLADAFGAEFGSFDDAGDEVGLRGDESRADRIRAKQRTIEQAADRERKRHGLKPGPSEQLDASGSYPSSWLQPQKPVSAGFVTHGGSGHATLRRKEIGHG